MPDFAVKTAFTAVDGISPAFARMSGASNRFANTSTTALGRVGMAANSVKTAMMGILPFFGVAAIASYVNKAIELASSLQEVQNVVDTTFGTSAAKINMFAESAIEKFGLSELAAKEYASTLGAIMKPAGITGDRLADMSMNLTGLIGDFVSFRNLRPEEAFEKIRAGITGETEPLKSLGIVMTQVNLEAFALTQGITKQWKAMSQQEQTMLRYNFIMANSKDAQGDFNKTLATSYANQKKLLGMQFDQALAQLATGILPSLTEGFKSLNQVFKNTDWKAVGEVVTTLLKLIPPLLKLFIAWKAVTWGIIIAQKTAIAVGYVQNLSKIADMMKISGSEGSKFIIMLKQTALWQKAVEIATIAWGVAQKAINFLLYICPVMAVVGGLIALGFAINEVYTNWDKYQTGVNLRLAEMGNHWDYAKYRAYQFLNMIGLVSDESLKLAKIDFMKSFDAFTVAKGLYNKAFGPSTAPNEAAANLQGGGTTVNINSNGTEAKAEITPRQGAKVNMNKLGYQQ